MTKREEIQENTAILLYGMSNNPFTCKGWLDAPEVQRLQCRKNAHFLMVMLEDKGVVIKDRCYGKGMDTRGGYNWKDVFFVIPLIEEEE